ncbi:hypothetical protein ACTFIV_000965 [Dictyostelium citrinum]
MKLIQLFFFILVLVSIAIASMKTDGYSIEQRIIGSWKENGATITQYAITIDNDSEMVMKSLLIETDSTLCLRDKTSIWNIEKLPNGDLTLPVGHPTIDAFSSYTFYFILKGNKIANLHIKSVEY